MRQAYISLVVAALLFVFAGRVALFYLIDFDHRLDADLGKEISCDGVIDAPPKVRGEKVEAVVLYEDVRLLLSVSTYVGLTYGDTVECRGVLRAVSDGAVWRQRVFYEVGSPVIKIVSHNNGNRVLSVLYGIKSWFVGSLYNTFSSPHGELIAGLTIEGADAISRDLKEQFRRTSLSHIVALSGTNVSIIIEAVFIILAHVRRSTRFTIGFIFILFFALMTGLTATIIRASLMAGMSLLAQMFHRTYNPMRALLIVSFLMILWNPLMLFYDISFQLSFMATLSMILVTPIMEKYVGRFIPHEITRETLVTTLSAQVLVTPLILYYSGSLSIISPVSNLLVLPVLPWLMLLGAVSVVLQYLGPLVYIVSLPAQVLSSYVFWIVKTLSALPFAAVPIRINVFVTLSLYGVIIFVIWMLRRNFSQRQSNSH